jgi:hypothetical protein
VKISKEEWETVKWWTDNIMATNRQIIVNKTLPKLHIEQYEPHIEGDHTCK